MFQPSERTLTFGYILAVSLVALLCIASHLTLDRAFQEYEGSATVIDMSGQQRMLSQRIASLAAQHALGDPSAKNDLLVAVEMFETVHRRLVEGDPKLFSPAASWPELQAIYFDIPDPLDRTVALYAARARRIATLPVMDPSLPAELGPLFAIARDSLPKRLDAVAGIRQKVSERQSASLQWLEWVMLLVILLFLLVEAIAIFRPMVRRIRRDARDLLRLATTDVLTGALNRRSFIARGQLELDRAIRHGRPLSLLMLDADHFKKVNDTFGHAGGDAVLRALADHLARTVRSSDLFGRLGDEEFAILLPETVLAAATGMAERLRAGIAAQVVISEDRAIVFTVSIGVAMAEAGRTDVQHLLNAADAALHAAKVGGRNRVSIGDQTVQSQTGLEGSGGITPQST
ncbi:MAG TPA: diguanylate cyclase [Stellaceae bacterium]|nr:diguanylate cyclase [Stellaceae bacterium]